MRNALRALAARVRPDDWIMVHDAARPCFAAADLALLKRELSSHPVGGLLAIPLADTLKRALEPLRDNYDFIIIDCPPALSLLTLNALTAADSILVPMQCEYYALEGLSALLDTIEALKGRLNPALEIEGVLRTMFDVRNNLANAVSAELTTHFGDKVFRTIVPRNVRLAEAPSHGQSIVGYDKASRGAVAYLGLAGEVLRRQRERDMAKSGATPKTSSSEQKETAA